MDQHVTIKTLLLVVLSLVCLVTGVLIGHLAIPKPNYVNTGNITQGNGNKSSLSTATIRELLALLNRTNIENNVKYFSREPHWPGSPRQEELAFEMEKIWREYGLVVDIPKYDVLMTIPDERNPDSITVMDENGRVVYDYSFSVKAKSDPSSNITWTIPRYFPSSPSGTVTGGLLYVNQGLEKDLEVLRELNISCDGSILIMREIQEPGTRKQLENAINCNASAVLVFNLPHAKDLEHRRKGNVYPNSTWHPKEVPVPFALTSQTGDPLTPELPSIDGIYRLDHNEERHKIPVHSVPYSVATDLLSKLQGAVIPEEWEKTFDNKTYNIGPLMSGNSKISLKVNSKERRQEIHNVIGTIEGWHEPDHWVIIGNHRDAISFGAMDAVSGTSVMMEISRVLGELLKKGWRPRRTIKFCSWDAEESSLLGSTEWVEENIAMLREHAVLYINLDWLVHGNYTLKSKGNPMLRDLIFSQTKLIKDPHTPGKTLYSTWMQRNPSRQWRRFPQFMTPGRGTDYDTFYQFAGIPSLDLQYQPKPEKRSREHHTPYDTYHMSKMVDPKFNVHYAQAELTTRLLFKLVESPLISFNLTYLPLSLKLILERTERYYGALLKENNITLNYLRKRTARLKQVVELFEKMKKTSINDTKLVERMNRRMVVVNKLFLNDGSFRHKPSVRNVLYGIGINKIYPNITLPAVSDAIELAKTTGRWSDVKHYISVTQVCIEQAIKCLEI